MKSIDNIYWVYLILVPTILVVYFIFNKKNKYGFSQIEFWKFWKQNNLKQLADLKKFRKCSIFTNIFLTIAVLLWFSLIPELMVMGFASSVKLYTTNADPTNIICDSRFYYKIVDATTDNNSFLLHLSFYGIYNIITMVAFIVFANLFYWFSGYIFKVKKWSKQSFFTTYNSEFYNDKEKKKIWWLRIGFLISHFAINISTHLAAVLPFTASKFNWTEYITNFNVNAHQVNGDFVWTKEWTEIPSLVFNFISIASVTAFLFLFFKLNSITYLRYQKAIIEIYKPRENELINQI